MISADLSTPAETWRYTLNTALFSDYTKKLRTLYIPPGTPAEYQSYESFDFPVGTIVSKTFYFDLSDTEQVIVDTSTAAASHKLIETRLLVRQPHGWDALPYIWQDGEAYLAITGGLMQLDTTENETINYLIPSKNQCASCHASNHTSGEIQPIGLKARHLHRQGIANKINQLDVLVDKGWLNNRPELSTISAMPTSKIKANP